MKTIIQFFEESVKKYENNIFLWENKTGEYIGTSYKKTKELTYKFGAGLMAMGLSKGDRTGLISEGRNEWVIAELGVLYTGAINVPLSVKLEPNELLFRLKHAGCKYILVSANHLPKIKEIEKELPELEKIIVFDKLETFEANEIYFQDVLKSGEKFIESNRNDFENRYNSLKDDDYANICYTSGTTADPKGIILSHRNYTANVEQALSLMTIPEHYKTLLILPWDHAFAHTAGVYSFMAFGASIASIQIGKTPAETLRNIPKNIKEIQPSVLLSVPALAKNFRKNIEKGIREKGATVEKLFNKALKLAYSYNGDGFNKGRGLSFFKKPLYALYDKIIFSKIRENFGGKLDFFIGGGALLDIELQKFFYAIGMPMFQGYGLSEAAPIISSNSMVKHKLGSSGYLVTNLELKICDEDGNELPVGEKGEIVVKGENVMKGYWQNETATKETLRNGWLYTGDMGYMDKDGFLYVLGRFKSLLIGDDGEKYSPEGIEEAICDQSSLIDQCMLYNNQNDYTVGLLVPNKEAIIRALKANNINPDNDNAVEEALNIIQKEINEYKKNGKYDLMFPYRWLPAAISVLKEGFTEENKMLNSTLKMVRGKITEIHKDKIDYLYTPEAKNILHSENIEAMKSILVN
ncbi:MAG: AMP-binding protein [Chlorobi bacterium]|nr:AMP-binding protein [Chlorobiota bacterium]